MSYPTIFATRKSTEEVEILACPQCGKSHVVRHTKLPDLQCFECSDPDADKPECRLYKWEVPAPERIRPLRMVPGLPRPFRVIDAQGATVSKHGTLAEAKAAKGARIVNERLAMLELIEPRAPELEIGKRNPGATCRSCAYRFGADPATCRRHATKWHIVELHDACGEHPEFWAAKESA